MHNLNDITIITVTHNSMAVLPQMLASIPQECPVVLVDNGSTKALPDFQQANVSVISNGENLGFGRACNIGAKAAATKWLLFLNPDAELSKDTLAELLKAAGKYSRASAFNPRILNTGGREGFKRRSVLLPKSEYLPRNLPKGDIEIPVLLGAAIFTSRDNFNAVGGFDENIFLYHEDDDLALRLRRQIGPLMRIENAIVKHCEGYSSGRSAQNAEIKGFHMGRSRIYALQKHGRKNAFGTSLAKALLGTLSPAMLFSKRKRAKSIAFLKGVWSARQDGGKHASAGK